MYTRMARRNKRYNRTRVNESIRAREVRLVDADGENVGVMSRDEAIEKAREEGLDLIEIAPQAKPPVAKIMDYGKFKYQQAKEEKKKRQNSKSTETKVVQVKINTGEHDLELKAKRTGEWLEEGHRVKVELYLRGRAKGLGRDFHKERIDRFLKYIPVKYKVAQNIKKGPKGLYMIIEKS